MRPPKKAPGRAGRRGPSKKVSSVEADELIVSGTAKELHCAHFHGGADRVAPDESTEFQFLVSAAHSARLCGISERKWWQLLAQGVVPPPIRLGRRTLWSRRVLDAWTAAGCRPWHSWRPEQRGGAR
jgi:predicted DNA-binding transcriptional regulator AlpA